MLQGEVQEVVEVEGVVVVVLVLRGHPEDLGQAEDPLVTTAIQAEYTTITLTVQLILLLRKPIALKPIY